MSSFPFDAVVFDLDGTLVATERYWPDAARSAALEFFADRGLESRIPSAQEWLEMVGLPPDEAFTSTFPDLEPSERAALRAACNKKESELLGRGQAAMLDQVPEVLALLRDRGVRLGVASNCGADYLSAMMQGLGLERWIEEPRCLASPGIRDKADMIADILAHFDTRSAVMVGDRRGDRDAAWANGIPHVHIPRGYGGGAFEAEAILDGIDRVPECLGDRERGLRSILDALGDARRVAITGLPMSGKSMLARDLARLADEGRLEVSDDPPGLNDEWDAVIVVTAPEEILVRRARGLRRGVGPVESLLEELPAAKQRLRGLASPIWVDAGNPLSPRLLAPRAKGDGLRAAMDPR